MATAKQIAETARTRFMLAGSLRMQGLTYAAIGKKLGVSPERARQLVASFDRDCTRTARWNGLKPHEYMALKPLQDWLDFLTKESK